MAFTSTATATAKPPAPAADPLDPFAFLTQPTSSTTVSNSGAGNVGWGTAPVTATPATFQAFQSQPQQPQQSSWAGFSSAPAQPQKSVDFDPFGSLGGFSSTTASVPTASSSGSSGSSGFSWSSAQPQQTQQQQQQPQYRPAQAAPSSYMPPSSSTTAAKPAVSATVGAKFSFDDLLSGSGIGKPAEANRTLKDMQVRVFGSLRVALIVDFCDWQLEERAKTEDPVKLRVEGWCKGREQNVRALLSSLQDVLWEGAKWKPLGLGDVCGQRSC
jgi:hypothetical protein